MVAYIFMILCSSNCRKFRLGDVNETKLTWLFTRKFCECPGGEYFNDTIWPGNNHKGINSAKILFFNNNPTPATFHFILNNDLESIQKFTEEDRFNEYSTGPDSYNPGLPSTDQFFYSLFKNNPNSANSSFWLGQWNLEGSISMGLSFSPDFPFNQSHNFTPNDTIYYSFFLREELQY